RVAVESVTDTGETVPVYNLRVADHHTYFVGRDEWGWSAWAHNTYYEEWVKRNLEVWKNDSMVKPGVEKAKKSQLKAMFRSWCDSYDFLNARGSKEPKNELKVNWTDLKLSPTPFQAAYQAFVKLWKKWGQAALLRDQSIPMPADQKARYKAALQFVATYQRDVRGTKGALRSNPRVAAIPRATGPSPFVVLE
nr:HINT domain-containing protein [Fimbriiglobus sp.]